MFKRIWLTLNDEELQKLYHIIVDEECVTLRE